jgi:3-oxocholest-4-en-26-oyl-CoA dehydrogenase alpha subunit
MDFAFTQEEEKLLKEVNDFLKKESTPELEAEFYRIGAIYGGPEGRKVCKKMGEKGWLCPTWPKKYGGLETSEMVRFRIIHDMLYRAFPSIFVGANMAGPTIIRFGSDEMKNKFLPEIASGDKEYALGYTEPEAGSDLASLEIWAEDKGDHFLLNGQKMFNTHTHVADYHWLAARTDRDVPKHKGISLMIVDLKSPGITIRPMITMAGWQTNEVFYDNVVVPKSNLVGEKNFGMYYTMAALDFERMFPMGSYQCLFDDLVAYAKQTKVNGKPLTKDPMVRQKLAELEIELEATSLLYYQLAYMLDKGVVPNYQTSEEKLFATETAQHITDFGMQILGLYGQLKKGSKYAPFQGRMEAHFRWSIVETVYAGTSEVQRNIIALRGLGLPTK